MEKQIDKYGNETFIVEQCDFDNSLSNCDIKTYVTEDDIKGGIGTNLLSRMTLAYLSCNNVISNMLKESIRLQESLDEIKIKEDLYSWQLSTYDMLNAIKLANITDMELEPLSIDTQITTLKSQLKHCKNPLQKLNMEREMNRLIREKGRR